MYIIRLSNRFKKDCKKFNNKPKITQELKTVISILSLGQVLPRQYMDHKLQGKYSEYRECHITPDVLLIYQIIDKELILLLTKLGSHSNLFG